MMLYFKQYPSSLALILCVIVSESNTITTTLDSKFGMLQNCGNLCSYIDQCNTGYYEENNFMQSLCDYMMKEVSRINDETEVLKIEGRYIKKFHQYDIERHKVREKRSIRQKVILNMQSCNWY